jgi:uncharacterized protein (DUF488 family)
MGARSTRSVTIARRNNGRGASMIWTVGHSSRSLDELLAMLRESSIATLADVRRFPGSRRFPHFGRDALAASLPSHGIEYRGFVELGGRRKSTRPREQSANAAFEVEAFRNYADAMEGAEMQEALASLEHLARESRTAIMCAEKLYWQCHRRILSDALHARGWRVMHLLDPGIIREHTLAPFARVADGRVTYPASQGELFAD